MATISFAPSAQPAAPVVPSPEVMEKEIAVIEPKPLATATTPPPAGIEGEITAADIRPPRINLAQRVGEIGEKFTPGTFVYDKTFQFADGKTPFMATVLRFKKYYQQRIPYGDPNRRPLKFNTAAEVRANGGQVSMYNDDNYYQEAADILLAIEAPESVDEEHMAFFPYVNEGKNYGLAVFTITSSAFTSVGKRIITDATLLLRDGLWNGQYRITSERSTNAQNSWFVPVASFDKKHTPEAAQFFRNIAGL